ncbi:class I SAM-dependent methyltransferase [Mesoterricola silvestris]|uniref:class I SAM-dependent methyltransferase n=1 Tax=Mesoterricola silvestris TaxID=2927979 RepID=UPI0029319DD1|nr:class I SAM-dependent methyltransferase [Mesoterricola silvestris]
MPQAKPSALLPDPDAPAPYTFERVQRDSDGGEVARLEAQNLLFEKARPLDQLPPTPPDGAILDLGSGTGFWSARLAERVPRGSLTCLDRSGELLDLARTRLERPGGPRTAFLLQDLRALDLPQGAFDLVFTSMTLAHVRELEEVLNHLARALKPGGWIACFEPVQQSRRFAEIHPPCPNLDFLMDRLLDMVESRGSDLSVSLKIAHHLDRLGLEEVALRNYGAALHGEDARVCLRDVFLPLAWAYLRHRWEPGLLERRMEAAAREAPAPHLWLDLRRAVTLARRPA